MINEILKQKIVKAQRNEISEYHIYRKLAARARNENNKRILERIAEEEKKHYYFWHQYTDIEVKPSLIKIWLYSFVVAVLGINFGARLMESGEQEAQNLYKELKQVSPEVASYIIVEEQKHEREVLDMIDTNYLQYTGSFVLGLSDAIIELSGALAGLTLALQRTNLIGMVGLITGIAAAMSMAGSEFLSTREEGDRDAWKASVFTGIAYLTAVAALILPYFIFTNPLFALFMTLALALLIILFFTFYISVSKNVSFKSRFWPMAGISLGVALINYVIGLGIRRFFHIEV